jgi:hypothetical protein
MVGWLDEGIDGGRWVGRCMDTTRTHHYHPTQHTAHSWFPGVGNIIEDDIQSAMHSRDVDVYVCVCVFVRRCAAGQEIRHWASPGRTDEGRVSQPARLWRFRELGARRQTQRPGSKAHIEGCGGHQGGRIGPEQKLCTIRCIPPDARCACVCLCVDEGGGGWGDTHGIAFHHVDTVQRMHPVLITYSA